MSPVGWAYYSSAADDEMSLRENRLAFQRIWLRPRVLVDVTHIDTSTTFMGTRTAFPVYISASAVVKYAHPDGEVALTRAAAKAGIIQMVPTVSSCPLSDILAARAPGQTQWFQLYVNGNRDVTAATVKAAAAGGCTMLCVTVDAPRTGRREKDMRHKITPSATGANILQTKGQEGAKQGVGAALASVIDPSVSWKDLPWLRSLSPMKLCLKGVQTGEDAVLAARGGVDAIILSNHGGRQLDTSRSGIEVLEEVVHALRHAGLLGGVELYVDGGVRRGTDIFKAIALGARGVGLARPFLYALASYGLEGLDRCMSLLASEFEMCMRLMGVTRVCDIAACHVDARSLSSHAFPPPDALQAAVYEPLSKL